MFMRKMFVAALICSACTATAPMVLAGFHPQPMTDKNKTSPEATFVETAAQINLAEVAMGQVALKNSSNDSVKKFAQQMIDDHTQANKDLEQAAVGKNLTVPADPSDAQKEMCNKLSQHQGADFDQHYISHMITGHENALAAYQTANGSMTDADLKAYAVKTIPVIQSHLQMAKDIKTTLPSVASDK